jgi:hypothetical protein
MEGGELRGIDTSSKIWGSLLHRVEAKKVVGGIGIID